MAFPSDILLPVNAKYFGFIDPKLQYNSNYDINWSFEYAITGTEHGFCTFLTTSPSLTASYPGHYLGYIGDQSYLLNQSGEYLLTENGEKILLSLSGIDTSGVLGIAFDSTGLFALSTINTPGVGKSSIKKNSLIIRDNDNKVVFNEQLSAIDPSFSLAYSTKTPQILRFRFANGNKISIDYKTDSIFKNLTSVPIKFNVDAYPHLYVGYSYTSPVSSIQSPSTLYLKNFHTQGNISDPTTESTIFVPITAKRYNSYTTLSGVSAYPI